MYNLHRALVGAAAVCALCLAGCAQATLRPTPTALSEAERTAPPPSPSPIPATPTALPTDTPEPLAASVNGQPVSLAEYEREMERCRAGYGLAGLDPAGCPADALQSLIEQRLAEQAAARSGVTVDEAEVEAARAQIAEDLGGDAALAAWQAANLYSDAEFRQALMRDLLRARLMEQVTAIGNAAEQVHARALLVADETTALELLAQLQSGADFASLAVSYSRDLSSRPAGGDLGWFPRGLLTVPEVEEAAFNLAPGETSGVIRSSLGFHIVQTLEHDPQRPLSPAAAQALQTSAYSAWLERLLAEAAVEKYITP